MGLSVLCNDEMIWSPGNLSGNLFAHEIKGIEQTVKQESGVHDYVQAQLDIDAAALDAFIQRVLQFLDETSSAALFAMMAGCTEVAIALNAQITGEWPEVSERLQPLVERARTVLGPIDPGTMALLP